MTDPLTHIITPRRSKQHTPFLHLVSYNTIFFPKEIILLQLLHMELRVLITILLFNGQFRDITKSKPPSFKATLGYLKSIHVSRSPAHRQFSLQPPSPNTLQNFCCTSQKRPTMEKRSLLDRKQAWASSRQPCQDLTNRSRATASPLEGNSLGQIRRVPQPQTNHLCLYACVDRSQNIGRKGISGHAKARNDLILKRIGPL